MDCVKACPHDNIGILPRSMTQDVLASEPTSSLGTLARRTDVAAAAAGAGGGGVCECGGDGGAGGELSGGGRAAPAVAALLSGSFAGVLAGVLLAAGVVWLVSQAARGASSRREVFCRGALALVPLGMGMWAAHLLFHLLMGVPGLLPLTAAGGPGPRSATGWARRSGVQGKCAAGKWSAAVAASVPGWRSAAVALYGVAHGCGYARCAAAAGDRATGAAYASRCTRSASGCCFSRCRCAA